MSDFDPTYTMQVVPQILQALRDYLTLKLITEVDAADPTKADLVRIGKFQQNPLDKNVIVDIHAGDHEEPNYVDGRVDNPAFDDLIIRDLPPSEVGGPNFAWWRRGTIQYHTFFVRQNFKDELAHQYAYNFQGRLLYALEHTPLDGIADIYGEVCEPPLYIETVSLFESGGPDKYIFRGKIHWRVLTVRT